MRYELLKFRIGDGVRKLRESHDISQVEFKKMTGINIDRLEGGRHNYSLATLYRVCNYFQVTVPEFLTQVGNKNPTGITEYIIALKDKAKKAAMAQAKVQTKVEEKANAKEKAEVQTKANERENEDAKTKAGEGRSTKTIEKFKARESVKIRKQSKTPKSKKITGRNEEISKVKLSTRYRLY